MIILKIGAIQSDQLSEVKAFILLTELTKR